MEFRCRLASASGEVVEGVYVAEDEPGCVMSWKKRAVRPVAPAKGALAGCRSASARTSIPSREF